MKIAFLCLVIYAYIVNASDQGDNEPIAQQAVFDGYHDSGSNQAYYGPVYRPPQSTYRPRPNRNSFDLSNPFTLYFLIMLCMSPQTTVALPTTTAAMTTATTNPLTGCTPVGDNNCCYLLSADTLNWDEAKAKCEETENAGLAVIGFNAPSAERQALIAALGAAGMTFWIGVDNTVAAGAATASPAEFIAPLDGVDATDTTNPPAPGFGTAISDSSAAAATVCGRVDATDVDLLQFEACATEDRRYICEICI